jgi:Holliday junction resolvase RusA-like endonuclease
MVTFNVIGTPQPKGSMKAFPVAWRAGARARRPGIIVTSDNTGLKAWSSLVRYAAICAQVPKLSTGPVTVGLAFRLPRPDYLRKKKLATQPPHVVPPDLDKLCRGALDPLTGVAWSDDKQVDSLRATKRYCDPQEEPGVTVFIKPTVHGD